MMCEIRLPIAVSSLRSDDLGDDLWTVREGGAAAFDGRRASAGLAADDDEGATACTCWVGAAIVVGRLGCAVAAAGPTAGAAAGEAAAATGGVVGATPGVPAVVATDVVAGAASTDGAAAVSELVRVCGDAGSGLATGTVRAESVVGCGEIGAGGSITGSGGAMALAPEGATTASPLFLSFLFGSGFLTSSGTFRAWLCA